MTTAKTRRKGTAKPTVERAELMAWLQRTLEPERFHEYCPNGLQVQGRAKITRLVSGVTASARFIDAAAAAGAEAILVHHGWFWRGEDPCVVGIRHARMAAILRADINLIAYHLPLDAHPELGNNVRLADRLGWPVTGRAGRDGLVFYADLGSAVDAASLARLLTRRLDHEPLMVGAHAALQAKAIRRIAWCTGGAQDAIDVAIDLGAAVYISGEISERQLYSRTFGTPSASIISSLMIPIRCDTSPPAARASADRKKTVATDRSGGRCYGWLLPPAEAGAESALFQQVANVPQQDGVLRGC